MTTMDNFSSEELVAKIAEGDNDSFEILVNRHQTSILNLIYRFIGDRTPVSPLGGRSFACICQGCRSRFSGCSTSSNRICRFDGDLYGPISCCRWSGELRYGKADRSNEAS